MSEWRKKTLNDIAFLNPSETLNKHLEYKKISMDKLNVFQRKISGYEYGIFNGGAKFRNNDTLLAKITPCLENGKTAKVDILDDNEVAFGSTEFIVLRAKDYNDSDYLYYLCISPFFRKKAIELMTGTSGRKRVDDKLLKYVNLTVPHYKEQQKIASVLSALDEKIELNNRINNELEAMAKTLYDYWFVQFDFPDENGKPYKSAGGKMVYSPELKREIPEGWGAKIVESILDKPLNTDKVPQKEILDDGIIPVIDQSTNFIAGYTNNQNALIRFSKPYIVFGDHTRIIKFINFDFARGADGTQLLSSKEKNISNYLLLQQLLEIDLSNYGYARHFKFLKEKFIVVPTENINTLYEMNVKPNYDLIKAKAVESRQVIKIRDFLLPMLMNGQVRVK